MGIVELGWIIVDLSRCKLKGKKKKTRGSGCDDKSFHFFFSRIQYLYTQYSSESCHSKWGIAIASSKTLKIFISSWFPSSSIRLGVLRCMHAV